jgi:hypothetical protein
MFDVQIERALNHDESFALARVREIFRRSWLCLYSKRHGLPDPTARKIIHGAFLIESRSGMEPSSLACLLSPAGSTSWPDFRHPSPPSSAEATL